MTTSHQLCARLAKMASPSPLRSLARYANSIGEWGIRYNVEKILQVVPWVAQKITEMEHEAGTPFFNFTKFPQKELLEYAATTPMCGQMLFAGEAMAPAISTAPRFGPKKDSNDMVMLMVRQLRYPEFGENQHNGMVWIMPRRAHVGDVVAFRDPDALTTGGGLMVRRVAALEDAALESSDPETPDLIVPKEHAWVVADNEADDDFRDSRTFGPVDLRRVVGRVVYAVRSATDHGVVHNSAEARWVDDPVVRVELDVEQLAKDLTRAKTGAAYDDEDTEEGEG